MSSRTRLTTILLALSASAAANLAHAATSTASLAVSATVTNNCTISTTPLAFGAYDPVVANATTALDGVGTVTTACTKGATTTVALNLGANASGTTRRLSDGAGNFLPYEIYLDSGRSTVWGTSGANLLTPAAAPSKAGRSFTAYGRVSANQDVPSGSYTDTVTATVNF
jgi:spore coat protein U-like protein